MPAQVVATREALRAALAGSAPGLVPTMGALHAGHLALIARAARENALTVVSVFVNPTQFSDPADLAHYPRDLGRDVNVAGQAGADLVFAPEVAAIYPPGFATQVEVGELGARWEGASRPGHFRGVATVVTILLNLVRPGRAYFAEKDYQQLQIVRRLHRDLALPGQIVGCPTVRDADGLALSSRNARLSPDARSRASAIPRAIAETIAAAGAGETRGERLVASAVETLTRAGLKVDYVAIVDGETLEPVERVRPGARVLVAVEVEGTRLIDNARIGLPE
jgi:pantoate--beta-alanine ligase